MFKMKSSTQLSSIKNNTILQENEALSLDNQIAKLNTELNTDINNINIDASNTITWSENKLFKTQSM